MLEEIIIVVALVIAFKKISLLTGILCFLLVFMYIKNRLSTVIKFHMVTDENGMNEAIIMEAKLNKKYQTLFMLDTGYAGPPVLSSAYLSVHSSCTYGSVSERYKNSLKKLKSGIKEDDRHAAINKLLNDGKCQAFTSGCTMKLVGIGSIVEQQADMLLCPMISFKNMFGWHVTTKNSQKVDADVLVTNSLPTSVNILTCDYLMHSTPVMIDMRHESLHLNMSNIKTISNISSFNMIPLKMMGGAFVIPIVIGGAHLEVTVDTGAPGPVCVGKNALSKIKTCWNKNPKKISQRGVNGEEICSDIVFSSLKIAGLTFEKVGVFANNRNVEDVDGYIGLGVLRALDILMMPEGIGFRKSGKVPRQTFNFAASGSCGNSDLVCSSHTPG
tara:strand:+ start:1693 stop:2850 length:1158 start_codon:yes stop_codon:yes gene_type:complete